MVPSTSLTSTLVDFVIFVANLYSFTRLEARMPAGEETLMSMFLVHKIVNRVLVWTCDYLGLPPQHSPSHGGDLSMNAPVTTGWQQDGPLHTAGYESPMDELPGLPHRMTSCPAIVQAHRRQPHTGMVTGGFLENEEDPTVTCHASLNDFVPAAKRLRAVGLRDRVACVQWTWYTMTMATGGIANVFSSIPFPATWLTLIGLVFFFLNLVLFVMNCVLITLRFRFRPKTFRSSFTDQVESLFTGAVIVSVATILITVCEYGIPHNGPWLIRVMEGLFWAYTGVSFIVSASIYLIIWSTLTFPIHTMTPVWVFPAYPMLLTAPLGSTLISSALSRGQLALLNSAAIAFACVSVQGAAFLISLMISTAFLYRLMTQKLPRDFQRPGMFVSVGPFGFTVAGIVGLGNRASEIFPPDFLGNPHAVFILTVLGYMLGLWLWGLAAWFFLVSAGSLWKYATPKHRLPFQITWFSFVFPNTALVTATFALGSAFDSHGLRVLGCVLAACLVLVWLFVFAAMVRALWRRELLWPRDVD